MNKVTLICPKCKARSSVDIQTNMASGPSVVLGGILVSWTFKCFSCGCSRHGKFGWLDNLFYLLSILIIYFLFFLIMYAFYHFDQGFVSKPKIERAGLNWNYVSSQLIRNDWAEMIDTSNLGLKVAPEKYSGEIAQVFGNDFSSVFPILKQSHNIWFWVFLTGFVISSILTFYFVHFWLSLWLQFREGTRN